MSDAFSDLPSLVLESAVARLEPLRAAHAEALFALGSDAEVFRWLPRGPFESLADTVAWIERATQPEGDGPQFPFAVVHVPTNRLAGSTRYLAVHPEHRRLEIGWTWYGRDFQRTGVNTACKLLLLRHAFEVLGCNRVECKTDHMNTRSQAAIERIGATKEGVFRRHRVRRDGTIRDTVWYSIIQDEWPAVRSRLEAFSLGH